MVLTPKFDDALDVLAAYVIEIFGADAVQAGFFLRDGFGRLAYFNRESIPPRQLAKYRVAGAKILGEAAFRGGVINDMSSSGSSIGQELGVTQWVELGGTTVAVKLIDRRFFGRDWLSPPAEPIPGMPPVMVFGSIKGGVGRTSSMLVLALDLARRGQNILLIDLDLEAPGLGSMLFEDSQRPEYGVLDYLVESGLGGVPEHELSRFVGTSTLTDYEAGHGRVDLAPATGLATLSSPQNMMAKLARAMIEQPSTSGPPISLASQIRRFVERVGGLRPYDAILIDARAGLAELTAGTLLSLGATIVMFGTDHAHTFEGYRYLMAHLATLPGDQKGDEWRRKIRFVHAKASALEEDHVRFEDSIFDVLAENFYEFDVDDDSFNFSLNDVVAPHRSWRVLFDNHFLNMNPLRKDKTIAPEIYKTAYGSFIEAAAETLGLGSSEVGSQND